MRFVVNYSQRLDSHGCNLSLRVFNRRMLMRLGIDVPIDTKCVECFLFKEPREVSGAR